jgi:hypothetical protein
MEVTGDIDVRYLVDKKGNKTDVVLTLEEYEELIEDIHDLSVALERQNDQRISLRELEERLHGFKRGMTGFRPAQCRG